MVDEDFTDVQRTTGFVPVHFVCTTEYDATMPNVTVAYPRQKLENIFGEYISKLGLTQLRHRGDGEVRPCHLLLQWRCGAGIPRGGPGAHRLSQGSHL